MELQVLPTRSGGAAENMALDFLLLRRYPDGAQARLRHYGWQRPAFTFGFGQKIVWVRTQVPAAEPCELCRRPTGGGVVDHRDDWTYALVIPRGHPLEEMRAVESYRVVHAALVAALVAQGVPALLKKAADPDAEAGPSVCFQKPELYDVVHAATGTKIAGAAQKRNQHGLLFQGSIWKPAVGAVTVDWDRFYDDFTAQLANALQLPAVPVPWPEYAEGEVEGLTEQYSTPEWIEYR